MLECGLSRGMINRLSPIRPGAFCLDLSEISSVHKLAGYLMLVKDFLDIFEGPFNQLVTPKHVGKISILALGFVITQTSTRDLAAATHNIDIETTRWIESCRFARAKYFFLNFFELLENFAIY